MKTSRISLLLLGLALSILSARIAEADDAAAPTTAAPAPTPSTADRGARLKSALAQLNLTDDQRAKIKDIFTTVPAGKDRRQQIVAVLTPDQKEKLKQMIQERREDAQANGATTTPVAN